MRNIFLVRHGESIANINKKIYLTTADHAIPLSDVGKGQAFAAGKFLSNYFKENNFGRSSVRMWTSPYERTRHTASGILSAARRYIKDQKEHIKLCEQQFGLFDGLTDDELKQQYPNEYEHYKKCEEHEGRFWARMPLGESRFDVACRVHESFGTFHRDYDKHGIEDIIVICHGTTLRAFVMQWLHLTPEWFDAEQNPGNCWIRHLQGSKDLGYIYKGEDI